MSAHQYDEGYTVAGRPGFGIATVSQCQSHDHRNLRTNINVSAAL